MEEYKDKKDEKKKKGFLAWLKEKLGFGGRSTMGSIEEGARGLNLNGLKSLGAMQRASTFGRFGAGRFPGGGLFSFLGGKAGLITFALVAAAVGTTLYYKYQGTGEQPGSMSPMGDKIASYTPRILTEDKGSSGLDLFKDAAKGLKIDEENANTGSMDEASKEDEKSYNAGNNETDKSNNKIDDQPGFDNKPRLNTDMQFGLSNSLGGEGNNKFSAFGGFGNHMGKFGPAIKGDFAKNDLMGAARGGKLSPIKSQKRAVIAKGPGFLNQKGSKTAFGQAKAVKSMMLQPNYGSADVARTNMDKAWEGGTGSGSVGLPTGGSGVSDGGQGVVQTPSSLDNIDNTNTPSTDYSNQNIPTPNYKFDTPWASLLQKAMMLLMISAMLSGLAAMLAKTKWGMIVAGILAGIAAIMAIMVIMIGIKIMTTYGQHKLGMIYVIGGGIALAAAAAALAGVTFIKNFDMLYVKILAAAAGMFAMFASMAQGPAMSQAAKKQMEEAKGKTSMVSHPFKRLNT